MREPVINIPRYLISFTHEMTVSADSDTGRHEALFRGPIRKQHNFRVLTTTSSFDVVWSREAFYVSPSFNSRRRDLVRR